MTKVICFYGPPGSGKSTAAAGAYYHLKMKGYHCELVREYVKTWSWEDREIGTFDQPYLWGKQLKYESSLYGKVDYVITDSPAILAGFYEDFYEKDKVIGEAVFNFVNKAKNNGITYKNFWLNAGEVPYDDRGRYQTESQATEVSAAMFTWLLNNGVELDIVTVPACERMNYILKNT
jgi:hypothetical protein